MAYFKLMLMKPIHTNSIDSKYLLNTISEFFSQEQEYKSNKENLLNSEFSFCYTYNEKFSVHKHAQKELSFSMNEKILYNDTWITNPFASHMMIGTKLCLEDKNHDQHLFTVKNISYEIKDSNKILNITCQDSFSYQMSRQNEGYEITNDSSSTDFIGSKNIDWWIYFKIHKECYIPYTYLPLDVGLIEYEMIVDGVKQNRIDSFIAEKDKTHSEALDAFINKHPNIKITRIIKPVYDKENYSDYHESFPFSCSGSNANAALITAAETLGLMLNVYEHQTNDHQRFRKYYWVEPERKEKNSGLTYSPNLDIQNFSFSQAGESLITVMNVNGPTIEDEIITLIPDIPPFFLNYFMTEEWKESEFYPGFFTDVCQSASYHLLNASDKDQNFGFIFSSGNSVSCKIDRQNNLLIPIKLPYIQNQEDKTFKRTLLTSWLNKVEFTGSELELRLGDSDSTDLFYPEFTDWSIVIEETNSTTKKIIYHYINNRNLLLTEKVFNLIKTNAQAYLSISGISDASKVQINSAEIYMKWFRDASDEDLKFAAIADQCPWLENKLINFDYFVQHDLITPNDERELKNIINNELRINNGQLMQYTKDYYNALHSKTEVIATLTNNLDMLGAEMEASLFSPFSTEGGVKDSDFESIYNTYNAIWIPQQEKKTILNYGELITEYFNKYFSAQQRFLKNIYNFRDYWNKPIGFAGTGIYENKIEIQNFNDSTSNNIVLLSDLKWDSINNNFNLYNNETGVPSIKLYGSQTSLEELQIVNQNNFLSFYIPTLKEGAWYECTSTDKMHTNVVYAEKITTTNTNGIASEEYKTLMYSDLIKRFLENEIDAKSNKYYYREQPYYQKITDASWFKFEPTDNNPKDKWTDESSIKLEDIYNQKGLSYALTLSNYNESLEKDELGEWEAMITDDPAEIKEVKWKHLYKSYIEGFPLEQVYWYGKEQKGSNINTFDENIEYYTTWNNLKQSDGKTDKPETYLPVDFVTPKNYTNYFKRVATSEAAYQIGIWSGLIGLGVGAIASGLITYLVNRNREGYLAQSGPCFKVLDNKTTGFTNSNGNVMSFETGNRKYTDWWRLIYGTDANSDKLIKRYKNVSDINGYYKFWKWVAPSYSVLSSSKNLWVFDSSNVYPASSNTNDDTDRKNLYYKEKILEVLKPDSIINNQDKFLMLIIDPSAEECLFNIEKQDTNAATATKIKEVFEKTWTNKNSYEVSAIVHYPIYNSCVELSVQFEDQEINYAKLKDWLGSNFVPMQGADNNDISDYIYYKEDDQVFLIFLKLKDYRSIFFSEGNKSSLENIINDYYIYSTETDLPVNFYETEGILTNLYAQNKKDGNYKTVEEINQSLDEENKYVWKQESEEESYGIFPKEQLYCIIDKEQGLYKEVYSISDYKKDSSLKAYYQSASSFTETVFTTNVNTIKPTLYLYQKDTGKIVKYNKNIDLIFDTAKEENGTAKQFEQKIIDENNVEYTLLYTCSREDKISFGNMTNGTFWYLYHEYNETQPLLFEYAALIETQLTQYWTSAYAASHYTEYFIPEFWQKTSAEAVNHFNKLLMLYDNNNSVVLLEDFIPKVSLVSDPIINKTVLPRYKLSYIEDTLSYLDKNSESKGIYSNISTNNFFSALEVLKDNDAILNAFSELGWKAQDLEKWQAEKIGENEYGQTYYYVQGNSGKLRSKLPQELSKSFRELEHYNGLYIMLIKYLSKYYQNRQMKTYYDLQKTHEDIWRNIYQEYPGLLLEGNYTNDSVTDSKDLLLLAKNAFKDLSNPERNYSLTFIDINSLRGYEGQRLDIGTSIQLDINDYVEEYGDLSQALSQFLFISDISYDLRKDSDINLTVNIIKYQDKLIQRLAKLIK